MPYEPTWESLGRHGSAPQWYRDAVFGIYYHWGVYSVPAFGGEKYPRDMYRKNSATWKHHRATYGDPTEYGYHDFIPMFRAEKWDPDAWAELFKNAGADVAGSIAEHHDGFAMWDTDHNPFNAMERSRTASFDKSVGVSSGAGAERGSSFLILLDTAEHLV